MRKIIQLMSGLVLYLSLSTVAYAQVRTYSVIVPFSPGGPSDVLMRGIEPVLNARLEQHQIRLIVENAPGAGGQIGLFKLINNKDKLEFGFFSPFFAIVRNIRTEKPYDYGSVNFLGFAGYNKMVVISGKHTDISSINKSCLENKSVVLASSGVGSMSHLSGYYFAKKYLNCAEVLHIPYKTTSDAYSDLKAGRIDILADFDITARGHISSGQFNAVAEIKDTDLVSWHVFVSNKVDNPDTEIIKREFEALKKDKKSVDTLEEKFGIYKFSDSKDVNWLRDEFLLYKKTIDSIPQTKIDK